jgi:hypothetical protein
MAESILERAVKLLGFGLMVVGGLSILAAVIAAATRQPEWFFFTWVGLVFGGVGFLVARLAGWRLRARGP